jgi:hypothetical protein
MGWVEMTQDMVQQHTPVGTVKKIRVLLKMGNLLASTMAVVISVQRS